MFPKATPSVIRRIHGPSYIHFPCFLGAVGPRSPTRAFGSYQAFSDAVLHLLSGREEGERRGSGRRAVGNWAWTEARGLGISPCAGFHSGCLSCPLLHSERCGSLGQVSQGRVTWKDRREEGLSERRRLPWLPGSQLFSLRVHSPRRGAENRECD